MNSTDLQRALQSIYPARQPVLISGPPGIGKSQICQQAAKVMGGQFLDVRLVYHDPSDMKFPIADVAKKEIHWVNSLFPRDLKWTGIICLEELPQCPPLMQSAAMQLTLDRRVGEYVLPEGAWVVACGNRQQDRAGTHKLITPLLNRFLHLDLEVDHQTWHEWATTAGIAPEIRAFLKFKGNDMLMNFKPELNERAFATPRSWEMLSKVLPNIPSDLLHQVTEGCVGKGAAIEFVAFCETCRDLPDPDEVLANPAKAPIPTRPDVMIALCMALSDRAQPKNVSHKTLGAIITYADRLSEEYAVMLVRDSALHNKGEITRVPEAIPFNRKHREVLHPEHANERN